MALKRLLILGANHETARLVKKARQLGVYTVVTDNNPDSPAKKCADMACDVDGTDIDGLIHLVKENDIDGVLVGTADPLVKSYYEVCRRLNYPCYVTAKAVEVFSDKERLKRKCSEYGIDGVPAYTEEEVYAGNARFPVVVKPSDGRSGKGITVCYSREGVKEAIEKAQAYSQKGKVIFERYMLTDDVFFYYTFYNGRYILSAMADRFTTKEQKGFAPVVLGATYPSKYIKLYMDTLHDKMINLFKALDIHDGMLLMQAFVENDKFYVYDPGFRFQGGAPHILMETVNGLDQEEFMIRYALGEDFPEENLMGNDPFFRGNFVGSQVVLIGAGTIGRIEGIKELNNVQEICNITQRLYEGDTVNIVGSEQQVLARVHIVAKDRADFAEVVKKINNTIKAYDTKGNLMNLEGLSFV